MYVHGSDIIKDLIPHTYFLISLQIYQAKAKDEDNTAVMNMEAEEVVDSGGSPLSGLSSQEAAIGQGHLRGGHPDCDHRQELYQGV